MHSIVWFEIPVKDLKRAVKFYSEVLKVNFEITEFGPLKMAIFPHSENSVSGALIQTDSNSPSENGPLIYLNGGQDLSEPLNRVEKAGGKILENKTNIDPHGFIAIFKDTEGNRIGIHSMK